jgi:hypothetical protein
MTKKEAGNKLDELLTTDSWTIGGRQALTSAPKWFTPTPGSLEGSLSYESSGKTLFVSVSNGGMGYEVGNTLAFIACTTFKTNKFAAVESLSIHKKTSV